MDEEEEPAQEGLVGVGEANSSLCNYKWQFGFYDDAAWY